MADGNPGERPRPLAVRPIGYPFPSAPDGAPGQVTFGRTDEIGVLVGPANLGGVHGRLAPGDERVAFCVEWATPATGDIR